MKNHDQETAKLNLGWRQAHHGVEAPGRPNFFQELLILSAPLSPKRMVSLFQASVIALAVLLLFSDGIHAKDISVAFWNVENMFDQYDDPQLDAEDILTPSQVSQKLAKDAEVIKYMNADIVGLMEVENHQILRELVARHLFKLGYHYFVLLEGRDTRGIDVAMVSKHPFLVRSFAIPNFSRGIMAARFNINDQPFYVLVNHWKSRRTGDDKQRIDAAKTVVQIVSNELKRYEGKDLPVIVGGDLNDDHTDKSVAILEQGGLTDTFKKQSAKERWTLGYYNNDTGNMELQGFDHILINKQASSSSFRWKKSAVVRPKFMINERFIRGKQFDMPLDDYKDRIGYSDHFPVMATFELK